MQYQHRADWVLKLKTWNHKTSQLSLTPLWCQQAQITRQMLSRATHMKVKQIVK
jgi:hypothetical protein